MGFVFMQLPEKVKFEKTDPFCAKGITYQYRIPMAKRTCGYGNTSGNAPTTSPVMRLRSPEFLRWLWHKIDYPSAPRGAPPVDDTAPPATLRSPPASLVDSPAHERDSASSTDFRTACADGNV